MARLILLFCCCFHLAVGGETPDAVWLEGRPGAALADRQAVIIAADEYQTQEWNLRTLGNNVAAIRKGLAEAGIPAAAVRELRGRDVNADAIRGALRAAVGALDGDDPVLLVYWTGHGHADDDGTPRLFTHYTRENEGHFDSTISTADLAEWVRQAGAGRSSAQISTLLVIDACRNESRLAPPPMVKLTPLAVWQLFSTENGRYAQAPSGESASPFTAALAAALSRFARAGEQVGPGRLADQVRLDLQAVKAEHLPKLERPGGSVREPMIVRAQPPVAFAVATLDAASNTLLPRGANIVLDGVPASDPGTVSAVPGRHRLVVTAPGMRTWDGDIDVPAQRGATLQVRLQPWLTRARDESGELATATLAGVTVRFRRIPGGHLMRGSPPTERGRRSATERQAEADVAAFWLAETETTQVLWQAVTGANPSRFRDPRRPVDSVSWLDCRRFCDDLAAKCPGLAPRLPREIEWEWAARAGSNGPWPFGDDVASLKLYGNYADRRLWDADPDHEQWPGADPDHDDGCGATTAPVGSYRPNPWGLFDMQGNLAEWCADPWTADPATAPPTDPTAARALRGGSWMSPASDTRSAARLPIAPTAATPALGLRLVVASPLP
jgi:formylglycine-generating enzyme required for sulfatase activity